MKEEIKKLDKMVQLTKLLAEKDGSSDKDLVDALIESELIVDFVNFLGKEITETKRLIGKSFMLGLWVGIIITAVLFLIVTLI